MFNVICTIYNSSDHLRAVLDGMMLIKTPETRLYAVLDGCTDNSEQIVSEYPITKIYTNNVRETKCINEALKQVPQDGYNLILQDDVVFKDKDSIEKIKKIYEKFPNAGVVGFRHGCNFETDVLTNQKHSSETDLIQAETQHELSGIKKLPVGFITERQVVYKSPICISSEVYNKLGGYDERFLPIAHDDTEYCIRCIKLGLTNIVASLHIEQPLEWGGSRIHNTNFNHYGYQVEHMNLIRELYPQELEKYSKEHPSNINIAI